MLRRSVTFIFLYAASQRRIHPFAFIFFIFAFIFLYLYRPVHIQVFFYVYVCIRHCCQIRSKLFCSCKRSCLIFATIGGHT